MFNSNDNNNNRSIKNYFSKIQKSEEKKTFRKETFKLI